MAFSLTKEESYANISNILVWKLHVKGKKHHTQLYFWSYDSNDKYLHRSTQNKDEFGWVCIANILVGGDDMEQTIHFLFYACNPQWSKQFNVWCPIYSNLQFTVKLDGDIRKKSSHINNSLRPVLSYYR